MDRSHRAFGGCDDCELGLRSHVASGVHAVNTRLPRLIYPQQTSLRIQTASKCFMEVSRELSAEVEEQRITLKRFTLRKDNTLQLPR